MERERAVIGGEERIRGWMRSRPTPRSTTGRDRPFREFDLYVFKVRLTVGVCV